nr:hypothetical protein [Tanacetum cinerariifolium]
MKANSYGASHIDKTIPRKEKDPRSFTLPCYINNDCFDNALADLEDSVSVLPLSTYLSLGLDFIIIDMPKDIKVPLILERPFVSTAHAKIDVFKRKITLKVVDEKIIFKSVKPASSLIKRVYILSLRERMELYLKARLMEDMDAYRDEGMGDVIVGEPFLRETRIKARWFEEMITVYKEYLVKISKKARILELKRRYFEDYCFDIQYAVSIKEDMTYLCLHFTKDHEGNKINTSYPGKTNTPYSRYRM